MERLRAYLNIQNLCYWIISGGNVPQPKFCYMLNGYTLKNLDCIGCNKCKPEVSA